MPVNREFFISKIISDSTGKFPHPERRRRDSRRRNDTSFYRPRPQADLEERGQERRLLDD